MLKCSCSISLRLFLPQVLRVQRFAVPLVLRKRWTTLLQEGLLGQIRGAVPRLQRPDHHRPHHGKRIPPLTLVSRPPACFFVWWTSSYSSQLWHRAHTCRRTNAHTHTHTSSCIHSLSGWCVTTSVPDPSPTPMPLAALSDYLTDHQWKSDFVVGTHESRDVCRIVQIKQYGDKCCCIIEQTRYEQPRRVVSICLVIESHTFKYRKKQLILNVVEIEYAVKGLYFPPSDKPGSTNAAVK